MAELQKFQVEGRTERGKGPMHRMREAGMVPGIYYDTEGANIPVKVDFIALSKLYSSFGCSRVFGLKIVNEGKSEIKPALIKEIHHHPLKPIYNHVDFMGVKLDEKIIVSIPVHVEGKAKGIALGGVLGVFRETIEVECLPQDVPDALVLDVSDLGLSQNIHIDEVVFPEGVRAIFEDRFAVVGVVLPRSSDVVEEEKAEAEKEEEVA